MKSRTLLVSALLICFCTCGFSGQIVGQSSPAKKLIPPNPAKQPKTFGEFKRQFLNAKVVVNDVPFEDIYCLEWTSAKQNPDGTFSQNDGIYNHLSYSYKGNTATVVDIELAPSRLQQTQVGSTNAFGEAASEDDIDDPYMNVFVKFDDGVVGMITGYPIGLVPHNLVLFSSRESVRQQIEPQLHGVIGRNLFAVGYSHLYKPTATLEQISGSEEILARLSVSDVPLLTPLSIIKVKYIQESGSVVFKLRLPTGSEAIAYTSSDLIDFSKKADFLSHISGSLLASIPVGLTQHEIDAIKKTDIFRGMSTDALADAIGFEDSENDWGRGGKQYIYFGGKLVVYVDNSGKVVDWQSFE